MFTSTTLSAVASTNAGTGRKSELGGNLVSILAYFRVAA